jgi:hypothetical protein
MRNARSTALRDLPVITDQGGTHLAKHGLDEYLPPAAPLTEVFVIALASSWTFSACDGTGTSIPERPMAYPITWRTG